MKLVIQRVKKASLTIDKKVYSSIDQGIVVLVGINNTDTKNEANFLIDKVLNLRIFEDKYEKMNLSLLEISGEILVVSQFTLYGDCNKGRRPSFDKAARREISEPLYDYVVERFKTTYNPISIKTGVFGAYMHVSLINDGPATFVLEK